MQRNGIKYMFQGTKMENKSKKVIDGSNAKKIIHIHTKPKNEVYHKKWHKNVQSVNQHESVSM